MKRFFEHKMRAPRKMKHEACFFGILYATDNTWVKSHVGTRFSLDMKININIEKYGADGGDQAPLAPPLSTTNAPKCILYLKWRAHCKLDEQRIGPVSSGTCGWFSGRPMRSQHVLVATSSCWATSANTYTLRSAGAHCSAFSGG